VTNPPLPVGLCAQAACILEATARKPGNVHRFADFADVTYLDFILSAAAVAPELEMARSRPVGDTVLSAVRATRLVTATNTNLGIVLLLTPLAAVPDGEGLRPGVERVLSGLTVADAGSVYEAIRLANPGGLGRADEQDVAGEPTVTLREAMALAAGRDLVARQYADGYRAVFEVGLPALREPARDWEAAVIGCHLRLLAEYPDSLIARKRGVAVAEEASRRARAVLDAGGVGNAAALAELDGWLRADGHARNPGTTADLVTACLFVGLRTGIIRMPLLVSASR
jgi:triphosphoribosyl-dephospho-CoA synthase